MKGLNPTEFFGLLKETYTDWSEDKCSRLAAALAYYTIFSLAPLLVIILAILGLVFDKRADAQQMIVEQIHGFVNSPEAAEEIKTMIDNASTPKSSIWATVVGIVMALVGAGGLFGALQDSLNTIWEVAPKPGLGIMAMLRARFLSFAMVLGTGFLLLVSFVLSAGLAALSTFMGDYLPVHSAVLHLINFVVSFLIITLLFAMIYKVLPDVEIQWHDVWVGAAMTSLLFTIGKFVLGLYLGRAGVTSAYGAAGSLVLILLWINYAAQILFFGAEFTQVYAMKFGSRIVPSPHAVPVTEIARAKQGMPRTEALAAATDKAEGKVEPTAVPTGLLPSDRVVIKPQPKFDVEYVSSVLFGLAAGLFIFKRRTKKR